MKPILRRSVTAAGAATLISLTWGVGSASAAEQAEPVTGPYQLNFSSSLLYSMVHPDAQPQGVNDWGCTPPRR